MRAIKFACLVCIWVLSTMSTIAQNYNKMLKQLPHIVNGITTASPQAYNNNEVISLFSMRRLERRKLAVIIAQPSNKMVKDIGRGSKGFNVYQNGIARLNQNVRDVIAKFWKAGTGIEYKTAAEFDALPNKNDYVVAFCYSMGGLTMEPLAIPLYNSILEFNGAEIEKDSINSTNISSTVFAIEAPENNLIVYSRIMPDLFPTKAELAASVCDIMHAYNGYKTFPDTTLRVMDSIPCFVRVVHKGYRTVLNDRILLIRADWLDPKVDISKLYPYPYKVVSSDELDKVVMSGDPQYLFTNIEIRNSVGAGSGMAAGEEMNTQSIHETSSYKSIIDNTDMNCIATSYMPFFEELKEAHEFLKDDFGKLMKWYHSKLQEPVNDNKQCGNYASFIIPIEFSPDGGHANESKFVIKYAGIDSSRISISDTRSSFYDAIYTTKSLTEYWDGTTKNGSKSHAGWYEYNISGICGNNTYFEWLSGLVELKR